MPTTINDELTRIEGAKADIATAIGNKGVTVPANAKIDDFADLIAAIQTGGGGGGGGTDDTFEKVIKRTITSVDIPSGTTYIPDYFFSGCTSLSSVTFPSSLTEIRLRGFYNCNLTTVDLRGTGLTTISGNAFMYCRNLEEVYIPSTISSTIAAAAFNGCSKLGKFVILATTPPSLGPNVFANTLIESGTGKIYVPNGYGNTYKGATTWSPFANQIYELDSNGNIPT